ncbi:MAG: hypothetical protein CMD13_02550 [Flavobacteriales bacterium]|nr:hypothetical protein [Flavobacteriales bacterium]
MIKFPLAYTNIIFFVMIFFLPSFGYVALNSSSLALGFLVSLLLIWIFSFDKFIHLKLSKNLKIISILFAIHTSFIIFFGNNFDLAKAIPSIILIVFVILSALLFSQKLEKIDDLLFINIIKICTIIILSLGIFSLLFEFNFLGYSEYEKSIFPFAEPRHFVTSTGSFILTSSLYLSKNKKIFLGILMPLFIFVFQSVVLIFFFLMFLFFVFLLDIKKQFFNVFFIFIITLSIFSLIGDSDYFSSRLDFSSQNTNLTVLVFLQGWDEMFHSIRLTDGFGVGFQNMGNLPPSPISKLIKSLSGGFYMNRNDGAFLASKIISEFGFLGIFFVLLYLKAFFRSLFFLINMILKNKNPLKRFNKRSLVVFAHMNIVFLIIEVFAAGTGYFTTGVFLFIMSLIILENDSKQKITRFHE